LQRADGAGRVGAGKQEADGAVVGAALQAATRSVRVDGSGAGERPAEEREKWSARAMAASAKERESSAGGATQARASMVKWMSGATLVCKRE
jgi:hypothetical protein